MAEEAEIEEALREVGGLLLRAERTLTELHLPDNLDLASALDLQRARAHIESAVLDIQRAAAKADIAVSRSRLSALKRSPEPAS